MTEREWGKTAELDRMVKFLQGPDRERKLRLFAAACYRLTRPSLTEPMSLAAIDSAEQYADGLISSAELMASHLAAGRSANTTHTPHVWATAKDAHNAAHASAAGTRGGRFHAGTRSVWLPGLERSEQVKLLQDIFGNPFRPVALDRAWLTPNVANLAQSVYDDRQLPSGLFDAQRIAVLADALEEAGCDHPEILGHLREGGDHVRGCWVVDLLLEKE